MTDHGSRVVPAGWYEDPASTEHVRWWNGVEWTEHVREKPTTRTPASNGAYEQLALGASGSEFTGTGSTAVGTLEAEHEPQLTAAAAVVATQRPDPREKMRRSAASAPPLGKQRRLADCATSQ